VTGAEIVAAIAAAAALGKLTIDEINTIHAAAAAAAEKVFQHDAQLKTAPPPGPQKG
jgi:hypothetical protein